MGIRRKGRELALQLLYEIDVSQNSIEEVLADGRQFFNEEVIEKEPDSGRVEEIFNFARSLVEGVCRNQRELDPIIESHSTHWKISRMSVVDRNILRVAVFELIYCRDIPSSVSINEAIDVAKRYGTDESCAFVNGVLDHIAKDLKKNKGLEK